MRLPAGPSISKTSVAASAAWRSTVDPSGPSSGSVEGKRSTGLPSVR